MWFVVVIEAEPDGGYAVECPQLPGCISEGETREEALANIRDAICAVMSLRAEESWRAPLEAAEVEVDIPDLVTTR